MSAGGVKGVSGLDQDESRRGEKPRNVGWVWIGLLALAVATRLSALGHAPLAPDEARRALASLAAARGEGWSASMESPLLQVGNALLFLVLGAEDGIARLLPALTGVAVVMVPWLWRRRLGEVAALTASALLLISPPLLFAARRVESTALGVLGAGLLTSALLTGTRGRAALVVAGLALGLNGGPAFYDAALAGAVTWAVYRWATQAPPSLGALRRWWPAVVGGIVVALLLSVGMGVHWGNWDGAGTGLAAWLAGWRSAPTPHPGLSALLVYTPLTLLLLAPALVRPRPLPMALMLGGALAALLAHLRPGASPPALVAAGLPLALAAGAGVRALIADVDRRTLAWLGLHTLAAFAFWIPVGLALMGHAQGTTYVAEGAALLVVLGAVVLTALQILLALLFSLFVPLRATGRGAFLGLALALLLVQVRFAWGLAFLRPTSPVEPAVVTATSPDVRALRAMVEDVAIQQGQRRDVFDVTVLTDATAEVTPVVRWILRDFKRLRLASQWPAETHGVVVTAEPAAVLPTDGGWRGMRFVAVVGGPFPAPACRQVFPPQCRELARWYLLRTSSAEPDVDGVLLWRAD